MSGLQQSGRFRDLLPRVAYATVGITLVVLSFLHSVSAHLLFFLIAIGIWFETLSMLISSTRLRLLGFLIGTIPLALITFHSLAILTFGLEEILKSAIVSFIILWILWVNEKEKAFISLLVFVILNVALINWFSLPSNSSGWDPKSWIFWLVLLWVNDTFAYFTGRLFGKHKVVPNVSPGKTVEGLVGGFFFTIIASALYAFLFPVPQFDKPVDYLIAAVVVSIVGPVGDLFESAIKRYVGVKDSGKLLGPHGGLFDRMDAWLFVAACANLLS